MQNEFSAYPEHLESNFPSRVVRAAVLTIGSSPRQKRADIEANPVGWEDKDFRTNPTVIKRGGLTRFLGNPTTLPYLIMRRFLQLGVCHQKRHRR